MNVQDENEWVYLVVINDEEQYSIWPELKGDPPAGWRAVGHKGSKQECLAFIDATWTDMRPLSLRRYMDEVKDQPAHEAPANAANGATPADPRDDLVRFLSEGQHPVELGLRPERTCAALREALDRGFVHVKFTDTRGGTELRIKVDRGASETGGADFAAAKGEVRLVGRVTLDGTPVTCHAVIDLATLVGNGALSASAPAPSGP